jgi:kanamycin kinase
VTWEPVTMGRSGAQVQRRNGFYRKAGPDVDGEAARLSWLRGQGFPAAEVLDAGDGWIVMAELPGRSAAEPWSPAMRPRIIDALADVAVALHAVPAERCPFDRSLAVALPEARAASGTDAGLAAELDRTVPAAEDIVVTHGDLCVPNVLFDPETAEVTGIVDVGRLGRADRYVDLAIATRSIGDVGLNPQYGPAAAARFLQRYGVEPDPPKVAFYRLLDEF